MKRLTLLLSLLLITGVGSVRAIDVNSESEDSEGQAALEDAREAAQQQIEAARETAQQQIETARETAKQAIETAREQYKNDREVAKQDLEILLDKMEGADAANKTTIKAQFKTKLAELEQKRTALRTAHRAEIEGLAELRQEQIAELEQQRAEQITELAKRREELRTQAKIEITEQIRQTRLERVSEYATAMSNRLDAGLARALAIANKLQTRINQLSESDLKDTLNSQLAQLAVTEDELSKQISDAKTALSAIASSTDMTTAAATARTQTSAAVTTLRSLMNSYAAITNQLPE